MSDIFDPGDVTPPAGRRNICDTENTLGVEFPKTFQLLLAKQNGGCPRFTGVMVSSLRQIMPVDQICGVGDDLTSISVVNARYPEIQSGLIIFAYAGHVLYCFDYTYLNSNNEPTVTLYDDEFDRYERIFASFEEFLSAFCNAEWDS